MSGPFTHEITSLITAATQGHGGSQRGLYKLPWYLVVGDPGTGRSTAVRSMDLVWPQWGAPLRLDVPQPQSTCWVAEQAVFIEPEAAVMGPARQPHLLQSLCEELREQRPREPVDGLILVLNVASFIDLEDAALEAYANAIRKLLIEIGSHLGVDVPTYVVTTRYDTLWGFADVFQWNMERKREDPWGFTMPGDIPAGPKAVAHIHEELDSLNARLESFCFAKLASEDGPDVRMRAFQHLAEMRFFIAKMRTIFGILATANVYERPPWFRALALGSAVPGIGDRPRAGMTRFTNMGLAPPAYAPQGIRPGGLPIHAYMKRVILPERDLVPLRTRWRDDKLILIPLFIGLGLWLVCAILAIVFGAMS